MPNTTPIPLTFIEACSKYKGAGTFKVFLWLVTQMLEKGTTPEISVSGKLMAEHTGLCGRSVLLAVRELEADQHILRVPRSAFDVTTYRLLGFAEAEGTEGAEVVRDHAATRVIDDAENCGLVAKVDEIPPSGHIDSAGLDDEELKRLIADAFRPVDDLDDPIACAGGSRTSLRSCLLPLIAQGGIEPTASSGMLRAYLLSHCRS
jgi:hypothetical protein